MDGRNIDRGQRDMRRRHDSSALINLSSLIHLACGLPTIERTSQLAFEIDAQGGGKAQLGKEGILITGWPDRQFEHALARWQLHLSVATIGSPL